jgi:Zn-dependent peptidase ImmA (M78 family)
LHPKQIEQIRGASSYQEWKNTQIDLPDTIWGRAEYQAREFAGRLLVPCEQLIKRVAALKPGIEEALRINPDLKPDELIQLLSPNLGRSFMVSSDVIERRMRGEKISPI